MFETLNFRMFLWRFSFEAQHVHVKIQENAIITNSTCKSYAYIYICMLSTKLSRGLIKFQNYVQIYYNYLVTIM